jgi:hypothetical protein
MGRMLSSSASRAIAATILSSVLACAPFAIADKGPDFAGASSAVGYPVGSIATDSRGNVYFASGPLVFKLDTLGIQTVVAGNGTYGFSGDGGPATSASLFLPYGVAVDGAGNLYIADLLNQRIRKVDTTGTITTVAGSGTYGFSGDGGPAISANLGSPDGLAVDTAGNLYIADLYNRRIRKVDSSGMISTVAGNGAYGFSGDGGPATGASLSNPTGVAVDRTGNVYIADQGNQRIRKVDITGRISTVAGNGASVASR